MVACPEEQSTQHYRGKWHGFGPVADSELVVFAIFGSAVHLGDALNSDRFESRRIARGEHSLARAAFTTNSTFSREVASKNGKQPFVGVSFARVSELRNLRADIDRGHGDTFSARSVCITDSVEVGDFDGHAAMAFSDETTMGISQGRIGALRVRIIHDLCDTFSNVEGSASWATDLQYFRRRLLSLLKALQSCL